MKPYQNTGGTVVVENLWTPNERPKNENMRFYLLLKTSSTKKHTGMAPLFLLKNKTLYFLADNTDFVGLHCYNDRLNVGWVVLIKEPVGLQNKFSRNPTDNPPSKKLRGFWEALAEGLQKHKPINRCMDTYASYDSCFWITFWFGFIKSHSGDTLTQACKWSQPMQINPKHAIEIN